MVQMVNKQKNDMHNDDIETIVDTDTADVNDIELDESEATDANKIKTLRGKLLVAEARNRDLLEDSQRTKADFLNARRRLEEERLRDKERAAVTHIERLLPLCDSFFLAMQDKTALEASDPKWRRGIEGTYAQLKGIMDSYGIIAHDPTGEDFDPLKHEALSMIKVANPEENNKIITVIQQGYEQKRGDASELIRPARVTVGEME